MEVCGVNKVDQLNTSYPVQQSIESTQYTEIPCHTALPRDDLNPLEFRLEASDLAYDLSSLHLLFRINVTHKDGSKINPLRTRLAPINLLAYSMFSSVNLFMNNQRVTTNMGNYPFLQYVLNYLHRTEEEKKRVMLLAGWVEDVPGEHDTCAYFKKPEKKTKAEGEKGTTTKKQPAKAETTTTTEEDELWELKDSENWGFADRAARFVENAGGPIISKVSFDVALIPRLIPTGTTMTIIFHRTPIPFLLQCKEGEFKLTIVEAKLFALRMELTSQALAYQNSLLSSSGINYPALCYEVRTNNLLFGSQNLDWVPFRGEMPRKLYYFMCLQSAYNAELSKNAFRFQTFNLQSLQVLLNGKSLPINQPINKGVDQFYYMTAQALSGLPLPCSPFSYSHGSFIFVVDLSRTMSSASCDYDDPPVSGNLRLIGNFSEPLKESITILCIAEFTRTLHIDANRNPQWI